MVRQVESRASEGLEQLERLRALEEAERSRVLSAAIGAEVQGVELVDVLVSRSSFGTARLWSRASGVALLNPALLRLLAAEAKAASASLSLRHLDTHATELLDRFMGEANTRWEHETMMVGQFDIELPMLRFERDVVRNWQNRAKGI